MSTVWYALRSFLFYAGYACTMTFHPVVLLCLYPFVSRDFIHRYTVAGATFAIHWLRLTCGVRYEVTGREHIPDTPCVVLSKHQSVWETLFLQSYLQPAVTVAKRELIWIPFFGWGMALASPIVINRGDRSGALKAVLKQGLQRLSSGKRVIIYPEGTRMHPGQQGEYSAGGAMLAVKAGVPVLPVALNSGLCWPRGTMVKRPGLVRVVIGAPLASTGTSAKVLNEQARTWIETTMQTLEQPASALDKPVA